MGKGDKKSRKGKIIMGSYGNKRPRDPYKTYKPAVESKKED
ncbi:30S ribosomal protein THX [Sphingobacterium sp. HJSM2_6]